MLNAGLDIVKYSNIKFDFNFKPVYLFQLVKIKGIFLS